MKKLPWALVAVAGMFLSGCSEQTKTDTASVDRSQYESIISGQQTRLDQLLNDNRNLTTDNQNLKLENARLQEELGIAKKSGEQDVSTLLTHINEIDARFSKLAQAGAVDVTKLENGRGYKVTIAGDVLFESGKAEIREEGAKILDRLAEELKTTEGVVRIDGHTDDMKIAKAETKAKYPLGNWQLGGARSLEVLLYLKQKGVPENKMYFCSFGQQKPRSENNSSGGRKSNRRVELLVILDDIK